MPILQVTPLPAGTALRVSFQPAPGSVAWVLLRRPDADFAGVADPAALVVLRSPAFSVIDFTNLVNGTPAFYQLYSSPDGQAFAADGAAVSGTPSAFYSDAAPDPQEVLRDRIAAGMAVEVSLGNITPGANAGGIVPVLIAPYALSDEIVFPMVTIHLDDTNPSNRYVGDGAAFDMLDPTTGDIIDTEGWLASFSLNVVAVTLNGDERIALRKALRRIVQANLPVFDQAGMVEISFSQSDNEDFESKAATLYMSVGRFTCLAPAAVTTSAPACTGIIINANIGTDLVNG